MKTDYSIATLVAVSLQLHVHGIQALNSTTVDDAFVLNIVVEDTFVGPGLVECDQGHCAFAVQSGYGCSDPCHTQQSSHVYSYAFDEVSSVGVDPSNDIGGVPCSYRYADNIDASFPFQLVEIEEGCTATCTGCEFAPTEIFCEYCL